MSTVNTAGRFHLLLGTLTALLLLSPGATIALTSGGLSSGSTLALGPTTALQAEASAGISAVVSALTWQDGVGGSATLSLARGPEVCCSPWDWVGIYQGSARLAFVHSGSTSSTFSATFAIPGSGGTFDFQYSTPVDGWAMHNLGLTLHFGPAGPVVTASVSSQSWQVGQGGSVTLLVTRGPGVCCNVWDWVGIYQDDSRLAYVNSGTSAPTFAASFTIPSAGGAFTFKYSTSLDGWTVHDLDVSLQFGSAPAVAMGALVASYWWPTNGQWDTLMQAVSTSGISPSRVTAMLNVNNGYNTDPAVVPSSAWALWKARADNLTAAGLKVIAYVNLCSNVVNFACSSSANQGNRPLSEVQPEMDKYVAELGPSVHGFFLDDAGHSGQTTAGVLAATNYALGLGMETVHNPGTMSQDPVLFQAANITVMREGTTPGSGSPYRDGFAVEKSAMLLHGVGEAQWSGHLAIAQQNGFKYFYATAGGWDSCPSYLAAMLTAIRQTGEI